MAYFGRGKNRYQDPYTLKDMYTEYIKDKEGPYEVSYKDFVDICREYYKELSELILDGDIVKLPFRLGFLSVISKPTTTNLKAAPIDWKATVELGKKVVETNDHSDYTSYQFKWQKKNRAFVPNLEKYQLVMTRKNKRELAARIKSGEYQYFNDIKHD